LQQEGRDASGSVVEPEDVCAAVIVEDIKPESELSPRIQGRALVAVAGRSVVGLSFQAVIECIRSHKRPLTLSFAAPPFHGGALASLEMEEVRSPSSTTSKSPQPRVYIVRANTGIMGGLLPWAYFHAEPDEKSRKHGRFRIGQRLQALAVVNRSRSDGQWTSFTQACRDCRVR
jgi:hypothetical protein